jgi:nicotinate-nucleotide adenylyltransferase
MTRVALFGGSFDPVHVAHLILAECALEEARLERVIFVPARRSPHKTDADPAPDADRLQMLRLATEGNDRFDVSDLEMQRPQPSYTLTTVRQFRDRLGPQCRLCLLLGADSIRGLASWWRVRELLEEVEVVAFARPGAPLENLCVLESQLGAAAVERLRRGLIRAPLLEVSAAGIRESLRAGRSVRYLVPEPVLRHIRERGLYRQP